MAGQKSQVMLIFRAVLWGAHLRSHSPASLESPRKAVAQILHLIPPSFLCSVYVSRWLIKGKHLF